MFILIGSAYADMRLAPYMIAVFSLAERVVPPARVGNIEVRPVRELSTD